MLWFFHNGMAVEKFRNYIMCTTGLSEELEVLMLGAIVLTMEEQRQKWDGGR